MPKYPVFTKNRQKHMHTNAHSPGRKPLSGHGLFQTRDLDEARELVGRVFCPHRLDTIGRGRFDVCHNHVPGDRISLNYLEYGAKTLIAPGQLGSFYLLQIPLAGGAAITNGSDHYYSHPKRAALLNPHRETTMIWEEGCRQILVQIKRSALQEYLAQHLGLAPDKPVAFQGGIDLETPAGARLSRLVAYLVAEAEASLGPIPLALISPHIEDAVLGGLVDTIRHTLTDQSHPDTGPIVPGSIRRAVAFILANLDQPLQLSDIARATRVSERSLQTGFQRYHATTPMKFLRQSRLQRIHDDLNKGIPGETVTEIAQRWGVTQLGRFSHDYRCHFGCPPSQTLRNANDKGFLT
jgi:AraC-like DNA-binding protein